MSFSHDIQDGFSKFVLCNDYYLLNAKTKFWRNIVKYSINEHRLALRFLICPSRYVKFPLAAKKSAG